MKSFEQLTIDELWELRVQITLGSHYISDYENSFGFNPFSICTFFDGYLDYLWELAEEEYGEQTEYEHTLKKDNKSNLYSWFNCYDDLSWVKCVEE